MKKKLYLFVLGIQVVFFAGWIAFLEISVLSEPEVRITGTGYDPRNLLTGCYLNLRLTWEKTDCTQFPDNRCPTERFKSSYRYHLPELEAARLEKIVSRPDTKVELVFRLPKKGEPRPQNMLINGISWSEVEQE